MVNVLNIHRNGTDYIIFKYISYNIFIIELFDNSVN